jgi:16S rRNA (uracil1498-N3)-methyltransferase
LETIVEKATELGARRIRLLITRRTNADHTNLGRLNAIAAEAAEQTGRLDAPEIVPPQKLDVLFDKWSPDQKLIFCDEAGEDPAAPWGGEAGRADAALAALKNAAQHELQQGAAKSRSEAFGAWAVLIGPEGGFAPEERARLRSLPFVVPISLGPRILRADTAAIAALTLWQAALGDWR